MRKLAMRLCLLVIFTAAQFAYAPLQAAMMPESTQDRVTAIGELIGENQNRIGVIEAFLTDNPLPEDASSEDVERYSHYENLKASLTKQIESLTQLNERLTKVVAGTDFTQNHIQRFDSLLNRIEERIEDRKIPEVELIPAQVTDDAILTLNQLEVDYDNGALIPEQPVQAVKQTVGSRSRRDGRRKRTGSEPVLESVLEPAQVTNEPVIESVVTNEPVDAAIVVQNDDNADTVEDREPAMAGRSQVDPFTMESPPYKANPGRIWVRDAETKRWSQISDGEFIERRRENLRQKYSGALSRKLPITKNIKILDLNTGREKNYRARDGYEIQVVGFGPRGMIRVKVFDNQGQELSGNFVTIPWNIKNGTEAAAARDALNALEEIRDAGHIENSCRMAPATPRSNEDPLDDATGEFPADIIDTAGYRPGCDALADGITATDRDKLRQCMNSIRAFINQGSNRCDKIERMFALNQKEQDFAALLMTTKGEAPAGLPAGSPDHLMIMKSLENRKRAVSWWGPPLSVMDIALQPWQYSMFNDWDRNGRFDGTNFLRRVNYNTLIDSLIEYQTADWQPPGTIDDITHYYSPPAMVPAYSQPRWVSHNANGTDREVTSEIRVNGQPVVNRSNSSRGYHRFYTGIDGRANYSARRKTRSSLINECRR